MRKIKLNEYCILNGKKFFYSPVSLSFQCACCLYLQGNRTFIRDKNGIIIGVDLEKEKEEHSDNCYYRFKKHEK